MAQSGLDLIGGDTDTPISRPGEPGYEFARASIRELAPKLIAAGVIDDASGARLDGYFGRPGTIIIGPTIIAARARRRDP